MNNLLLALKRLGVGETTQNRKNTDTTDSDAKKSSHEGSRESKHADVSLKKLAIHGSAWTLISFGISKILRLGGNLVLTRLLFPEAFGVMALVNVVIESLQLFSDLGIGEAQIRDPRGEEPHFLNTLWTMIVIRGLLLWLAAVALCFPAAILFKTPSLAQLIPVAALSAVFMALSSPGLYILRRRIHLRPLMIWEIGTQICGLIFIVLISIYFRSVWAIVIGNVVRSFAACVSSYWLLPGVLPRFSWDSQIAKDIIRFGRWLFISTALTALIREGDKAVLGTVISAGDLGLYALASFWAKTIIMMLTQINQKVLFPVYSLVANKSVNQLRSKVYRARLVLMGLSLPPLWFFVIGGRWLIELLYDPRYQNAGWMLQILAVSAIAQTLGMGSLKALLAKGDSFALMIVQVCRGVLIVICMIAGGYFAGLVGLIVGIAAGNLMVYPVLAWSMIRHRLWLPQLDLLAIGSSAVVISLGLILIR
jgi:O-antigen/teichoic acid export membrane protein